MATVNGNHSEAVEVPGFTSDQIDLLKSQIHMFRRLSRGLPLSVPADALSPAPSGDAADPKHPHARVPSPPSDAPSLREQTSDSSRPPQQPNGIPSQAPGALNITQYRVNKDSNPYALLKRPVTHEEHSTSLHRTLIPAITPVGTDPVQLVREIEARQKNKIAERIRQLEALPLGLSAVTGDPTADARLTEQVKLRAIIELKSLKLLPLQKALRQAVHQSHIRATSLLSSVDRASYRRNKRPSIREARSAEKLERQQRVERERKDKAKQLEFVDSIVHHGTVLKSWHKSKQQRAQRLGQTVLKLHTRIEKEESLRAERMSKERLRALREDDEEAYLKLVTEAKDTRITSILNQTSSFLKNLSAQVLAQQKSIAGDEAIELDEASLLADDEEVDDLAGSSLPKKKGNKLDYYSLAHRIHEPVFEQPEILSGGKLKEYQIKGLEWMVSLYNNRLNGILADEMGLGKTIQTISLITYLIEKKKQNGPFLVIVPLSTLTNWTMEFEKWAPTVTKIVYKGAPLARKALQQELRQGSFNVLLTTYQYIINDKDRPSLSRIKWVHMIIDEGHRVKNSEAKLVQILTTFYQTRYRLILTGTPLQNNLPELWSLLNFICPKIFDSVKTFDEWFNSPFNRQVATQENVNLNEEEQLLIIKRLHKVLRPFLLRRLKKDVESQLPDKVEYVIKCNFSPLQQRLYDQIRKYGVLPQLSTVGKKNSGVKALRNTIMHLRKICNHPYAFHEVREVMDPAWQPQNRMHLYRISGKFELLDRILPKFFATGHKVLMFFQMTLVMDVFEEFCQYRGIPCLRLDGHTKHEDRAEMMKRFNTHNQDYMLFILSTRAGGLGLNLQVADTVIIFDSDWNPHQDLQAQDRAHRIGQTKEVRILRLVTAKSIEENILARAQFKLDMDSKVIQAGKFDNKSTNEEREAFLRALIEVNEPEEKNDIEEGETNDEDLNDLIARSEEEVEVFRRMDQERAKRDIDEWRALGHRGKPKERLIQDDELPEIFLRDAPPIVEEDNPLDLGRGQRQRGEKRAMNEDQLANNQWQDSDHSDGGGAGSDGELDAGAVSESSMSVTGSKRKREEGVPKLKRPQMQDLAADGDSDVPSVQGADGGANGTDGEGGLNTDGETPRKRGKKQKPAGDEVPPPAGGSGFKLKMKMGGPPAPMETE